MTNLPPSSSAAVTPDVPAQASADVTFFTVDNFRPENSMGYAMRRIMGFGGQAIERAMEPLGLTDAQWKPLLRLYMGQAGTVAESARLCEMDAGSMTRLLDRIEAKGLLRRVRSSADRRVVNLELTAEGQAAAAQIPGILAHAQNVALRGFSEAEWQTLQGFLGRILHNVQTTPPEGDAV